MFPLQWSIPVITVLVATHGDIQYLLHQGNEANYQIVKINVEENNKWVN